MIGVKILLLLSVFIYVKALNEVPIPLPFSANYLERLEKEQLLTILGTVKSNPSNIVIKNSHEDQVALKLLFDFNSNTLTMSSEPRKDQPDKTVDNPLKAGEPFTIQINGFNDCYHIVINEISYVFQTTFHDTKLEIDGDLDLLSVTQVPYSTLVYYKAFPGGRLAHGQKLVVRGIPVENRFQVNFLDKSGDIYFHLNPRYDNKETVRDSRIGNWWRDMEREPLAPKNKFEEFTLTLQNCQNGIQIRVNDEKQKPFKHRIQNSADGYVGFQLLESLIVLDYSIEISPVVNDC